LGPSGVDGEPLAPAPAVVQAPGKIAVLRRTGLGVVEQPQSLLRVAFVDGGDPQQLRRQQRVSGAARRRHRLHPCVLVLGGVGPASSWPWPRATCGALALGGASVVGARAWTQTAVNPPAATTDTSRTAARAPASDGLRRHQRQPRSSAPTGRAAIGSPRS